MNEGVTGIDIEALCAPISDDAPAGFDVREDFSADSLYFRLRDLRAEARALERQADASGATDPVGGAQWAAVQDLAQRLLRSQAKDLEVAAWLSEALLRRHGLDGLAAGARLMTALAEGYWDGLHPLPDAEEGVARRCAPVAGLNGEGAEGSLIQPLRKLALFERPDGTKLAFWHYRQAEEAAGIGDEARRQQRLAAGVLSFDAVEAEAKAAADALAGLRVSARASMEAWNALAQTLERHAGSDAPPMSRVRDLLADVIGICDHFVASEHAPLPGSAEGSAAMAPATASQAAAGAIATREDALKMLEQIASFFRATEPHSPLAYTLRETVRRARLSWPELLEEIVPNFEGRAAILNSLGIRPPPPPE